MNALLLNNDDVIADLENVEAGLSVLRLPTSGTW